MKVLIDTNIIIDGLQSRKGFMEDAGQIILRACDYDGFITASSITDIFYLQKRFFRDDKKAKENLAELFKIFGVLDTTEADCRNALRSDISDYEDAVQMESALRNGVDMVVTRNSKDFEKASIKVYTPIEFLRLLSHRS